MRVARGSAAATAKRSPVGPAESFPHRRQHCRRPARGTHYAEGKRSDIRVSCGGHAVPVEIKKNTHPRLWSAINDQLIDQYARAGVGRARRLPRALVRRAAHQDRAPSGRCSKTPEALREHLTGKLAPDQKRKMVVDVSGPGEQPPTTTPPTALPPVVEPREAARPRDPPPRLAATAAAPCLPSRSRRSRGRPRLLRVGRHPVVGAQHLVAPGWSSAASCDRFLNAANRLVRPMLCRRAVQRPQCLLQPPRPAPSSSRRPVRRERARIPSAATGNGRACAATARP